MTATLIETIPTVWDESRDGAFFRITARLFSSDFCFGASVLLASYDLDETTTHTDGQRRPVGAPGSARRAPVGPVGR